MEEGNIKWVRIPVADSTTPPNFDNYPSPQLVSTSNDDQSMLSIWRFSYLLVEKISENWNLYCVHNTVSSSFKSSHLPNDYHSLFFNNSQRNVLSSLNRFLIITFSHISLGGSILPLQLKLHQRGWMCCACPVKTLYPRNWCLLYGVWIPCVVPIILHNTPGQGIYLFFTLF